MDTMTDASATAEQMRHVTELIERGATREARRRMSRIAETADAPTRALLVGILTSLESGPIVMRARLQHLWKQSDDAGRALIEACFPTSERRAEVEADRTRARQATRSQRRDSARQAPRDLPTRWTAPRPRRSQHTTDNDTAARRYFDERDDPDTVDAQSDYDQLDYDLAAVPPMRGLPCVACGVERSTRDRQRTQDDGLCEDCRDNGTAGVPILPPSASRADILTARCDHIAATSASPAERDARLRRDWRHLRTADRFTVTDWHAHLPA